MALFDVIQYDGDNGTFLWKHPSEDFNMLSQLIVHQSQEAVFLKDGRVLDLFGPGRYTLDSDNLPLLSALVNLPFGGTSPFHCEVYFINKSDQMAIKWGTDSKVEYLEPTYRFPIQIGACGEMSLRVRDSYKLLTRLVGVDDVLTREGLSRHFRSAVITRVKTCLAQYMRESGVSIFEIDSHLEALSQKLQEQLAPDFEEYGLSLERFYVMTVLKPEEDPTYRKFKYLYFRQYADIAEAELRQRVSAIDQATAAQKLTAQAKAMAEKRSIEGYTYQQERTLDVAEAMAGSGGAGALGSMGMELGIMTGVSRQVGQVMDSVLHTPVSPTPGTVPPPAAPAAAPAEGAAAFCGNCGHAFAGSENFCPKCGGKRSRP